MTDAFDLTGAVDIHAHVGPSLIDRKFDGYECARDAANADLAAVVMKEHFLPTVYGVPYIDRLLDRTGTDVQMVGSMVMNYCNGGFNPFAVETALNYGAGVIWAPTIDARHHAEQTGELGAFLGVEAGREYDDKDGLTAVNDDGAVAGRVRHCIEKIAAHDAVLAIGHLSPTETIRVAEYAADLGHEKVLIDHPTYQVTGLDAGQREQLASLGATLNFPYLGLSSEYGWTDPGTMAENIRAVGVDNCVLSSDVGQATSVRVPAALRSVADALHGEGFSESELQVMLRDNPGALLGLS